MPIGDACALDLRTSNWMCASGTSMPMRTVTSVLVMVYVLIPCRWDHLLMMLRRATLSLGTTKAALMENVDEWSIDDAEKDTLATTIVGLLPSKVPNVVACDSPFSPNCFATSFRINEVSLPESNNACTMMDRLPARMTTWITDNRTLLHVVTCRVAFTATIEPWRVFYYTSKTSALLFDFFVTLLGS